MNPVLRATPDHPVVIYYCKAGVKSGLTVRVQQGRETWQGKGVLLKAVTASMIHNNATGKPKASGARCVLQVTAGIVGLEPVLSQPISLEPRQMQELERDCLIFREEDGEENRYFKDVFDRSLYCKCLAESPFSVEDPPEWAFARPDLDRMTGLKGIHSTSTKVYHNGRALPLIKSTRIFDGEVETCRKFLP